MTATTLLTCDACGAEAHTQSVDEEWSACSPECQEVIAAETGCEWPEPDSPEMVEWKSGVFCDLHEMPFCHYCKPRANKLPHTVWITNDGYAMHRDKNCQSLLNIEKLRESVGYARINGGYSTWEGAKPVPYSRGVEKRQPCSICWGNLD